MSPKHFVVPAVISTALALPLGGFVFGFLNCEDCGANIFGRALVGVVYSFLTTLGGGFPVRNEGGVGDPFNAWPHIIVTWLLLIAFFVYRPNRKNRPGKPGAPEQG